MQCSIDESTISAYVISRAVQLKKTRFLTYIEKLNYFNNHSIPASNLNFQQNNMDLASAIFNFPG